MRLAHTRLAPNFGERIPDGPGAIRGSRLTLIQGGAVNLPPHQSPRPGPERNFI
jgi:hypothetical protein